jgi:hypothetical protein
MLNDGLNRNDLNRDPQGRTDVTDRGRGMGGMMIAALGALAVLALVWMWAPWGDTRSAVTNTGTTVGSSTARPGAPGTTPVTPAAPAPNR